MEPDPCPPGDHPDPSGAGSHRPAQDPSERGDARTRTERQDLHRHPRQNHRGVTGDRDRVGAHRATRYQPADSHPPMKSERLTCDARTGSINVLIVGWAKDDVVSDGCSKSWVSSHSPSTTNTPVQRRAPVLVTG